MRAVEHANRVLDWHVNLAEEEVPPQWMWIFEEDLTGWFEKISRDRKSAHGGTAEEPEEGMIENEYARGRR